MALMKLNAVSNFILPNYSQIIFYSYFSLSLINLLNKTSTLNFFLIIINKGHKLNVCFSHFSLYLYLTSELFCFEFNSVFYLQHKLLYNLILFHIILILILHFCNFLLSLHNICICFHFLFINQNILIILIIN